MGHRRKDPLKRHARALRGLNAVACRRWSRVVRPCLGGVMIRADGSVRGSRRVEVVVGRMEGVRAGWVEWWFAC